MIANKEIMKQVEELIKNICKLEFTLAFDDDADNLVGTEPKNIVIGKGCYYDCGREKYIYEHISLNVIDREIMGADFTTVRLRDYCGISIVDDIDEKIIKEFKRLIDESSKNKQEGIEALYQLEVFETILKSFIEE